MKIVATVDVGNVLSGFKAMEKRGNVLRPAFERLKAPLKQDQMNHQSAQEGPDGKWPARKSRMGSRVRNAKGEYTAKRGKRGKRKRARKVLGKLPQAVKYYVNDDSVVALSRVLWASAHQEGATVGRGVKLPARPFLWLSNDVLRVAEETIAEHITGVW